MCESRWWSSASCLEPERSTHLISGKVTLSLRLDVIVHLSPPHHHSILITAARPRPYSRTSSWTLNSADVRHEAGTRRAPGALRLCVALPLRAADLLLQSSRSEPRDHGPAGQNAHLPPHGEHFDVYLVFGCCHWPFRLHVVMGMFWCVAEIVR